MFIESKKHDVTWFVQFALSGIPWHNVCARNQTTPARGNYSKLLFLFVVKFFSFRNFSSLLVCVLDMRINILNIFLLFFVFINVLEAVGIDYLASE